MRKNSILYNLREQLEQDAVDGNLPETFRVYFKNTLVAICHAMEDHVLRTGVKSKDLPLMISTFQQGKWYLEEADRYQELAKHAQDVVIMAVESSGFTQHPTGSMENVHLLSLSTDDPVAEEWNLIILAPDYAAACLCQELTEEDYGPGGRPEEDLDRKFYGLWTFDESLVYQAAHLALDRIGVYDPPLERSMRARAEAIHKIETTKQEDLSGVITQIVANLQETEDKLFAYSAETERLLQPTPLGRNLTANKLQAFLRIAQQVDAKDPYNPMASLQVAALAETLGQMLQLSPLSIRRLRLAALLHRVGLAQASQTLFLKAEDDLNDQEREILENHPMHAVKLLGAMPELNAITQIIARKKEAWDGSGKPDGLKGEEIPQGSRILGLVAHFQKMTQPRGTRPALTLGEAFARCQEEAGRLWDPKLVETLGHVVRLAEMGFLNMPTRPQAIPSSWLSGYMETTSTKQFRGADLRESRLEGKDLSGADFTSANLEQAQLAGADLTGIQAFQANLRASLRGADLTGAHMNKADLRNADLRGAILVGAQLNQASLAGSFLGGANLSGMSMLESDLRGSDLRGTDLTGTNLEGADLSGANLTGANLEGANLEGANLTGAYLTGANLRNSNLLCANLESAILTGAELSGACLRGTELDTQAVPAEELV
ncbi:MAG: pentapeptide repeat-containing protein [Gloeobacterales cyanobacterium]